MKRHTITLGASTSAGGKVITASSNGSIHGSKIALEGDAIFCPACKSQGKIMCTGPRIAETWNGKKIALEDDLCNCGCLIPPRLLPVQFVRYQTIAISATSASAPMDRTSNKAAIFDDRYILFDGDTGELLINTEYALRTTDGELEFGTTDANGHTHLISTFTESKPIEIYL
ncbi:PAAR domain-containing protein [Duganella qianjiadongensis]|uniref:PAAR domain-containing protein n=1 Tax=Duganella qianjiadongensis TaxID=2692176 RepID=A0ABW9VPF8_9BURK|nr:PAAR domain-containing protein [Duganella qianjiadongensis]MYM41041.1 hypothetical protein [Duganella qianjiadongensis]